MFAIATVSVSARTIAREWEEEFAPEREYYTLAERKVRWDRREEDERREAEWEAKQAEWDAWAWAWLSDPANYDDESYSDIYKDLFGFRPRGHRL